MHNCNKMNLIISYKIDNGMNVIKMDMKENNVRWTYHSWLTCRFDEESEGSHGEASLIFTSTLVVARVPRVSLDDEYLTSRLDLVYQDIIVS